MPISESQREVWRIREELDRKLSEMTLQERREYFGGALARLREKTGIALDLLEVGPPQYAVAKGSAEGEQDEVQPETD